MANAENLKIELGSAETLVTEISKEIRGRDIDTGLPRNVSITSKQIEKAMKNVKTKVTSEKIKSNAVPQLLQELKEIKEDIKRIYENQEKGMK